LKAASRPPGALAASASGKKELIVALVEYIQARGAAPLDSLRLFRELNDKLADPECMRRLQCQMGELAGGQEQGRCLDTMEQLQYICVCGVVTATGFAREQAADALSAGQLLDAMLPDQWVLSLGQMVKVAGSLLAGVREQLQQASDSISAAGLAEIARLGIFKDTAKDGLLSTFSHAMGAASERWACVAAPAGSGRSTAGVCQARCQSVTWRQ
jgi:hypothetical protein